MKKFTINSNESLKQDTHAFYHTDYVGYKKPDNPYYINKFKNIYNNEYESSLNDAVQKLRNVLLEDLPKIRQTLQSKSLIVCVVPRAKKNYEPNQVLFKTTVCEVVNQLPGFYDGTDYIIRHTNTRTTHLRPNIPNYDNDGAKPYPGITADTCNISNKVKGKNILLIDDVYTKTVNIDEDAIQSLLNRGAQSVVFYAVGRTPRRR